MKKQKWQGCLGVEGAYTGDRRIIKPGVLSWTDNFPKPIRWASADEGKHTGAEVVGHINYLTRRPAQDGKDGEVEIWGFGTFDTDSEKGAEAARQVAEKLTNGVSLDLDNIAFDVTTSEEFGQVEGQDAEVMSITGARVRAVTLVALPAFEQAHIDLVDEWSMLPTEDSAYQQFISTVSTTPDDESTSNSVDDEFDPDNEDELTGALNEDSDQFSEELQKLINETVTEMGLDQVDASTAETQENYQVPEAIAVCTQNGCDNTPTIAVLLDDDKQNDGPDLYCKDHYNDLFPDGPGDDGATLPIEIVPAGASAALLDDLEELAHQPVEYMNGDVRISVPTMFVTTSKSGGTFTFGGGGGGGFKQQVLTAAGVVDMHGDWHDPKNGKYIDQPSKILKEFENGLQALSPKESERAFSTLRDANAAAQTGDLRTISEYGVELQKISGDLHREHPEDKEVNKFADKVGQSGSFMVQHPDVVQKSSGKASEGRGYFDPEEARARNSQPDVPYFSPEGRARTPEDAPAEVGSEGTDFGHVAKTGKGGKKLARSTRVAAAGGSHKEIADELKKEQPSWSPQRRNQVAGAMKGRAGAPQSPDVKPAETPEEPSGGKMTHSVTGSIQRYGDGSIGHIEDTEAANHYLQEQDMTQYLPENLKGVVTKAEWSLPDNSSWQVDLETKRPLTQDEANQLKDWIEGQNSDGLGEGFEQQPFAEDSEDAGLWLNGEGPYTSEELDGAIDEAAQRLYDPSEDPGHQDRQWDDLNSEERDQWAEENLSIDESHPEMQSLRGSVDVSALTKGTEASTGGEVESVDLSQLSPQELGRIADGGGPQAAAAKALLAEKGGKASVSDEAIQTMAASAGGRTEAMANRLKKEGKSNVEIRAALMQTLGQEDSGFTNNPQTLVNKPGTGEIFVDKSMAPILEKVWSLGMDTIYSDSGDTSPQRMAHIVFTSKKDAEEFAKKTGLEINRQSMANNRIRFPQVGEVVVGTSTFGGGKFPVYWSLSDNGQILDNLGVMSLVSATFGVDPDSAEFKRENWVSKAGGLPPYIKRITKHLQAKGMTESHAIAVAVNVCKKACATGDLNYPGKQSENAGSRAEACAAVAHWEAMKAKAKASSVDDVEFASQLVKMPLREARELFGVKRAVSLKELRSRKSAELASTDFDLYVSFADDGSMNFRQYSKETLDAYSKKGWALNGSYPIATVQDLRNAIKAFGRAGDNKDQVKAHIKKRARALKRPDLIPDGWAVEQRDRAALVASGAVKLAAPIKPPKAWFEDPQFRMATPLTVTKEGRVFGHLATWGTCHTAQPNGAGECVTVPGSGNGYSWFHTGVVETAEGDEALVGRITMKTGHAADSFSSRAAIAHYENTGLAIADVHAGEDQFGVWISGALRPDATEMDIRALKASPLSGDWRWSDQTQNLELVMALAVNMPGFPVPRPHGLVASGSLRSLVAAGMLPPTTVSREQVERAKEDPNGLDAGTIRYLKQLAQKSRNDEAATLRRRALLASGAEQRIHQMAKSLASTAAKTEEIEKTED